MNVNPCTVARWKKTGKLNGFMNEKGKINITRALKELPSRISVSHKQSADIRWKGRQDKTAESMSKEEVSSYLNETIGDLSKLDIYELQRRNELEKLLLAQIKRRRESGELVEVEMVERDAFNAGKAIKEQCLAIADRTSPLVAAESDIFKCKEIIVKEVNYILESLASILGAGSG